MNRSSLVLLSCCLAAALAPRGRAAEESAAKQRTVDLLLALKGGAQGHEAGIKILEGADAAADIAAAKRAHDRRLIGFVVNQLFVPGLDPAARNQPPRGYTVVRVLGTSDDIGPGAQERFMSLLSAYARKYNQGLLAGAQAGEE